MEVFHAYSIGTSAWLTIQALPLLFTPNLLVSMLSAHPRDTTELEYYLSRTLAIVFLGFAALSLVLSGLLPVGPSGKEDSETSKAYAVPSMVCTTTYHAATAFYIYMQVAGDRGCFAFYAGMVFSSALFCLGVWTLVFGSEKSHVSKRTGADKRTSNFPLPNDKAARSIKKEEREREKAEGKEKDKERKKRSVARSGSSRGLFG
ncbi:Hypothetical protein R9X50_00203800 [Acrodontium crateriforme]|uniref:Uncharacterized protein n=1 Tax=Acrodontium crateriforme TaxID=150365 RepID=A0AAQ3M355_9PEZI|nr:Hypothetical protein R9X50_00203800 [Acrodontium crateriforme]